MPTRGAHSAAKFDLGQALVWLKLSQKKLVLLKKNTQIYRGFSDDEDGGKPESSKVLGRRLCRVFFVLGILGPFFVVENPG